MSRSLDIGCGDKPRNPFWADEIYGVDVRDDLEKNIKFADLAIDPIPFPDGHFDYVTAHDFLEHVPRIIYMASSDGSSRPVRRNAFIELMNEIHRVLKPGGLFLSITPAYPYGVAFRDPTHVNFISDETLPLYFDDHFRWASIYGFSGAFRIGTHKAEGQQIRAILQKVNVPQEVAVQSPEKRKVSIVIPVYNGEKYLSKTFESLCSQSFKQLEIICVDDCSTDSSASIIQKFVEKDDRIKALKPVQNLGSAPKVINFALQYATGDFFVYSSQDDLFSVDWVEQMHQRWLETGADAVIPDVVLFHEQDPSKNTTIAGARGDYESQLTGKEAAEQTLDWRIPGNALWNMEIIKSIGFEEFSINSDEYSVRKFFLQCNKVAFSRGTFFYRQDNEQAVTKKKSPASFDWPYTQLRVAQLLQEYSFPTELVQKELSKAANAMERLKKWMEANPNHFGSDELESIHLKIEKFERRLEFSYPFSPSSRDRSARRKGFMAILARTGRSIKKIPSKVIRLFKVS